MAIITIPKPLREKLGEEATNSLVELLDKVEEKTKIDIVNLSEVKFEHKLTEVSTKIDVLEEKLIILEEKINQKLVTFEEKFERRLSEEVAKINERIVQEISQLKIEISKNYANIIKWMFIFWLGQIGAIFTILFAFFR